MLQTIIGIIFLILGVLSFTFSHEVEGLLSIIIGYLAFILHKLDK
jgi:hypothetical protein